MDFVLYAPDCMGYGLIFKKGRGGLPGSMHFWSHGHICRSHMIC